MRSPIFLFLGGDRIPHSQWSAYRTEKVRQSRKVNLKRYQRRNSEGTPLAGRSSGR